MGKHWIPLESNPEVINKYIEGLGYPTTTHQFVDVFDTEEWAILMLPQPIHALVFLYPNSDPI